MVLLANKEMLTIALERIGILHRLSQTEKYRNNGRVRRYLGLMEKIAERTDITLPAHIKRSYCKRCKTPYGSDTRVRIKGGKIVLVTCHSCGDSRRLYYG